MIYIMVIIDTALKCKKFNLLYYFWYHSIGWLIVSQSCNWVQKHSSVQLVLISRIHLQWICLTVYFIYIYKNKTYKMWNAYKFLYYFKKFYKEKSFWNLYGYIKVAKYSLLISGNNSKTITKILGRVCLSLRWNAS